MLEGKKISAMLLGSRKKSINNEIIIPAKRRRCNECNGKISCITCNIQINENKEIEANLKKLEREPPKEFG